MRESGFYWVKLKPEWIIARWNKIYWVMPIFAKDYYLETKVFYDSNFEEIDERRIERTDKAILPDEDYNPIPDNPRQYISDNPYLCKP